MNDLIRLILFSIGVMAIQFVAHEAGHFVMARRLGWNPKLILHMWKGWMPCLAVKTDDLEFDIETESDFLKFHVKLVSFHAMGSAFSVLAVLIMEWTKIIGTDSAYGFVVIWFIYGLWEITHPQVGEPEKQ